MRSWDTNYKQRRTLEATRQPTLPSDAHIDAFMMRSSQERQMLKEEGEHSQSGTRLMRSKARSNIDGCLHNMKIVNP